MATQLQIRRGTAAQVAAFTGAEGEIVYNSTNDSLHTNDGATAGGFELARADLNNVSDADLNAALTGNTLSALTITTLTATGGTINGTVIGGVTPAAGSFTTGAFSGAVTAASLNIGAAVDGDVVIIGKTTGQRLHVFSNASALLLTNAAGAGAGRDGFQINNGTVITEIDTVPQLTITSGAATFSGNVQVNGVISTDLQSPSAWTTNTRAVQITTYGAVSSNDNLGNVSLTSNAYESGDGAWSRVAGTSAARYMIDYQGANTWSSAIAGAGDSAITWVPRMTLDASGNLLVGKTATSFGTAGIEARSGGTLWATASATNAASFNRLSTDGPIAYFSKDGTTVGSIGAHNGTIYFAGPNANTGGFRIDSSGSDGVIIPTTNTGANRDAAVDLGYSSGGTNIRFKDLYLSGNVLLGNNDNSALFVNNLAGLNAGTFRTSRAYTGGVGSYNDLAIVTYGVMNFFTNNSATPAATIDASGNLLVNCASAPATTVPGVGIIRVSSIETELRLSSPYTGGDNLVLFYNPNGFAGSISTSGSATAYNTSSDYRLKEDAVPMTGATERVKALRPINFAWKVDGSRTDGFLAHEAQEVVPEAVHGTKDAMRDEEYEVTPAVEEVRDEDGNVTTEAVAAVMGTRSVPDYQGIDQSKLVPLLTATIQELIARIEALEGA